jgi:hypothetical protein
MDELIFAPIRAEEAAERAIEAAKKTKKEPKKETESKVDTKVEKEKSNTASELSLDEDKENNDQNNVKGKKKQAKQSAITVNELLEQKSIVNEDLFKKELDDTFDVDVEVEQEVRHSYLVYRVLISFRRLLLALNAKSESETSTSNGGRRRCKIPVSRSYHAKQSNPNCILPRL